ncbi:MAG TPA: hypothetical protein VD862_00110 [Candidatus Paceibacterota bacterium]|nr:hypothetical protein [Candidatus Paceibacterota bacterium]
MRKLTLYLIAAAAALVFPMSVLGADGQPALPDFAKAPYNLEAEMEEAGSLFTDLVANVRVYSERGQQGNVIAVFLNGDGKPLYAEWVSPADGTGQRMVRGYDFTGGRWVFTEEKRIEL